MALFIDWNKFILVVFPEKKVPDFFFGYLFGYKTGFSSRYND